jgi:HD-GYP domain-containing protein (c-di-GMP phosphodiesterase class II)
MQPDDSLKRVVGLFVCLMTDYSSVITLVQEIVAWRDPYNHHMQRSGILAVPMAQAMGLSEYETQMFAIGAHLHDLGKLFIPEDVLHQPRRLSKSEYAIVKQHALEGYKLAATLNYDRIICDIILHHHENYDGTGYPDRLRGEHISIYARGMRILDVWDAMLGKRAYRAEVTTETVRAELEKHSSSFYDPALVHLFLNKVAG